MTSAHRHGEWQGHSPPNPSFRHTTALSMALHLSPASVVPVSRRSKRELDVMPTIDYEALVLSTGVVDFAPWLELHKVVVLRAKDHQGLNTGVFAIDFSPFNQTPDVVLALLKGQTVPAEIRVRWIPNGSTFFLSNLNTLKRSWCCLGPDAVAGLDDDENIKGWSLVSDLENCEDLGSDYDILLSLIRRIQRKWDCNMNLYKHNCIHFSNFCMQVAKQDLVCKVQTMDV